MAVPTYLVVGGGILGTAVAHRLQQVEPHATVTVCEKEPALAQHQSGRNSGVVHAGLYYPPGSLKARLCRRGVGLLREFCEAQGLVYDERGKVVVALDAVERGRLDEIEDRARANGVPGLRRLGPEELREVEPHVAGLAALHSPHTAIVDYAAVTRALAGCVREHGGRIRTGTEVVGLREVPGGVAVRSLRRDAPGAPAETVEERVDRVIVCAGLHGDRVAGLAGDDPDPRLVPFRGEYHLLRPERRALVRGLVYPVPDPRYPFLGVHFTPRVDGEVMVGPNAVPALAREGYRWRDVSPRDLRESLAWPGFRRFAGRHWRTGLEEVVGSISARAYVAAAARYVPGLTVRDVRRGPSGVRAQALGRDGAMVDDFRVSRRGRVVALRNAPSPAATSSLAIAEHLVDLLRDEG